MTQQIPTQGRIDYPDWGIVMFSREPAPFIVSTYSTRKAAREARAKMAKMKALRIVQLFGNVYYYLAR